MELYTLSSDFIPDQIVDAFESVVWAERYADAGEVTLETSDTSYNRTTLAEKTMLMLPESKEVMIIDSQSIEDGKITVVGKSLVKFLDERMVRNTNVSSSKYWEISGEPGWIAGEVVRQMCVEGGLMDGSAIVPNGDREIIPNLMIGNVADGVPTTIAVKYETVFSQIKSICAAYSLGFTLYPSGVSEAGYNLVFETYAGVDRTTAQSLVNPVVFEPSTDSLANAKSLRSVAGYKNVAYAWAPGIEGSTTVGIAYQDDSSMAVGFARRTLLIQADDINEVPVGTTLQALLDQRAKDELANNNYVKMVDGEVIPQLTFELGVDYNLGDVIELRNDALVSQTARITEIIRSQDSTGERTYPTLSVISE